MGRKYTREQHERYTRQREEEERKAEEERAEKIARRQWELEGNRPEDFSVERWREAQAEDAYKEALERDRAARQQSKRSRISRI